jgi:hypothetical protein
MASVLVVGGPVPCAAICVLACRCHTLPHEDVIHIHIRGVLTISCGQKPAGKMTQQLCLPKTPEAEPALVSIG